MNITLASYRTLIHFILNTRFFVIQCNLGQSSGLLFNPLTAEFSVINFSMYLELGIQTEVVVKGLSNIL